MTKDDEQRQLEALSAALCASSEGLEFRPHLYSVDGWEQLLLQHPDGDFLMRVRLEAVRPEKVREV